MRIGRYFFIVLSLVFLLAVGLFGCGDRTGLDERHWEQAEAAEEVMEMLFDLCDIAGYGIHAGIQTQPNANLLPIAVDGGDSKWRH